MTTEKDARRALPQWREDFPVEWEGDQYVTRRELAKFLTLGSGLLACATAAVAIRARLHEPMTYTAQRIASINALAPGESLLFRYPTPDDPCILIRLRSGVFAAFSQICTHLSCAVVYRAVDQEQLFCPCHHGVFECGETPGGARPIAGPPDRPLPRIALEVRGDELFAIGSDA